MDEQTESDRASKRQGVVYAVFVLALLSTGIGVARVWRSLYPADTRPIAVNAPVVPDTLRDALALEQKDTDGDGLTDAAELNRYRTSPYLADSDSDGTDDRAEITKGDDPNCPKDETCVVAVPPTAPPLAPPQGGGETETPSSSSSAGVIPPFSPEIMRAQLRQSGMTEVQLAQIDDATLRVLYDETIRDLRARGAIGATAGASVEASISSPSAKYTPAQLRVLLQQNGIDPALLEKVDDATLQQIFEQSVAKSKPVTSAP